MKKRQVLAFGLGSMIIGAFVIGFSLMQNSLSADATTSVIGQGAGIVKAVFIGGGVLFLGGIACFVYTSIWQR